MRLRLLRHATLIVEFAGRKLLIDPMLSAPGAMPAIENSPNPRPNPLVPLPATVQEIAQDLDAVLVTHTHRDHWDDAAARELPREVPLLCQPEDAQKLQGQGFTHVQPLQTGLIWNALEVTRTSGQHGTGEIGRKMAPVSGFVLRGPGEDPLYIAGDTIWCAEVQQAIAQFRPAAIVVNAGAARFLEGDPITMAAADVISVCRAAAPAKVIAVHMEAINHCLLTRQQLAAEVEASGLVKQVVIPQDGGWVA
ncbi:MAG TPA: MBL fold metallo-hydrolase [Terriglobales bacterium]|nr:MBL fold metallo-hydrolase [Terriglobales bacterium]